MYNSYIESRNERVYIMNNLDIQAQIQLIMARGFVASEMERFSKERDDIERAVMSLFTHAKEYRYIVRTNKVSFEQLDEWSNERDMETEGMDEARAWADYQAMNY